MTSSFIPDGYMQPGHIRAIDGLYEALNFKFRPMLPEERDSVRMATMGKGAKESNAVMARCIDRQVTEWDLKDTTVPLAEGADAKAVPKDPWHIRRLRPALFDRLYMIVMGADFVDVPEDATPGDSDDYAANLLESAATGGTQSETSEARDLKN